MIQNVYSTQGKGSVTFSIPSLFPFRYALIPAAESVPPIHFQTKTTWLPVLKPFTNW